MLKTLDYTIRIGSTPTFLYFDLYLNTAYAAHCVDKNRFSLGFRFSSGIRFSLGIRLRNPTWALNYLALTSIYCFFIFTYDKLFQFWIYLIQLRKFIYHMHGDRLLSFTQWRALDLITTTTTRFVIFGANCSRRLVLTWYSQSRTTLVQEKKPRVIQSRVQFLIAFNCFFVSFLPWVFLSAS